MKTALRTLMMILLFGYIILPAARAQEHDLQAVRARYAQIPHTEVGSAHAEAPSAVRPYDAGRLSDETLQEALASVNFIRWLAGLEPVELSAQLNELAQHGAVLMAANKTLSHAPAQPDDMDEEFFLAGSQAAAACNLAMFNWGEQGILKEAIVQFARDDSEGNRQILGHRRWLLYPGMKYTGFGLAQDDAGNSYTAMYVMDDSAADAAYELIAWPSQGAFPAEYMTVDAPWSVSLNPRVYDLQKSAPRITLTEQTAGAEFVFENMTESAEGNAYFVLGGGRYGDGPVYIFHPDLSEYNELAYGYQQNQVWTVRMEGLFLSDGSMAVPIEYTVRMISLTPIDPAAVEISTRTVAVKAGETAQMAAQVIPQWADDLSLTWHSENEAIATVDENGVVTGVQPGLCSIVARSVNGREDRVDIAVE